MPYPIATTGINIVKDTSPQLGGNLDTNGFRLDLKEITAVTNPSSDYGAIYTKDVLGITQLFFRDSSGLEVNLSSVNHTFQSLSYQYGVQLSDGQTQITLPNTPVMTQLFLVSRNGMRQMPVEDYTIAGDTITFITAFSDGDNNIVIDYSY
jgi:hypothetical protein